MEIKELDRQLSSGNLGRLYFFCGDEQFLMEHKIKSIKKKLIAEDFADFNFVRLDGKKVTATDIRREVMAVPAMSDMRMVVVQNTGIFGNAKFRDFKETCELLEDIPEYLCLIFTEREFDKKKEKNLDIFKKHGEIVRFDLLSPVQLERWLEKLFEDKGKSVLSKDLQLIISLCGQNMSNLFNEYQKLLSFLGERTKLSEDDVRAVVSKSTETRIFEVIESLALGKSKGVFDELSAMRSAGENPSTIMSLITTRLSELLMVKQLSFDKLSRDKIAEYFEPRKPSFVVVKLLDQSKGFSEEYLIKMTLKGPEYTAKVRSGLLDKWVAVEMYASELLKK